MSKTPNPPALDRRRLARLASLGVPACVIAELTGMDRLDVEAALKVDPQILELRRHYERLDAEPPEVQLQRLRRLFLAAVERQLEDGDLRNIGWALKGLGLLQPLPGSGLEPERLEPPAEDPERQRRRVEELVEEFDEEERALWEAFRYENWPVPPTVPWRPDAPRPRGPLEVENEAGTEAERAAEPLPWPPSRIRTARAELGAGPEPSPLASPAAAAEARPEPATVEPGAPAASCDGPPAEHGAEPAVPAPADRPAGASAAPLPDRDGAAGLEPAGAARSAPEGVAAGAGSGAPRWPPHLRPV